MITDKKVGIEINDPIYLDDRADYYLSSIVSTSDYYPFGYEMPDRTVQSGEYRYGFNGKEKDENGEWGSQTHYDYGFRIYNPAIARFLSVDPLTASYPFYTPYQFAGNKPIWAIDIDGLEEATATRKAAARKLINDLQNDATIAGTDKMAIAHLNKNEIIRYLRARLDDPALKSHYNSCGPTCAAYVTLTHDPEAFVTTVIQLWKNGSTDYLYGNITVPESLKNGDKHYRSNDDIDQLITGSLRYSENKLSKYYLKKQRNISDAELFLSNATMMSEIDDMVWRMGGSASFSYWNSFVGSNSNRENSFVQVNRIKKLSEWTSGGKTVVLFGYFNAMRKKTFKENVGGGDHFVTASSIKVEEVKGSYKITVEYWHHGEYSKNGYEKRSYTLKEFKKAFRKYSKVKNTGNKSK